MEQLLQRVRNKPFYCWQEHRQDYDEPLKRDCCFNKIIGMPRKLGKDKDKDKNKVYSLFNYEHEVIRALLEPAFINARPATEEDRIWYEEQQKLLEQRKVFKNKTLNTARTKLLNARQNRLIYTQKVGHLAIVKSTGLGLTTLMIRYIAWNCMRNDNWKDTDVIILTGPRQQLSDDLITMLKNLFLPFGITFDTKVSTIILNGVRIRAFPSDHLSAARGIPAVSIIYCDEASHFSPQSQKEVIDVIERYAGKSEAQIVLTSTPDKAGDLMHTILSQPFDQSFYKILKLNYEL